MARPRGRPPRSDDADEYIRWRKAEVAAAEAAKPEAAAVDDVANRMVVEPVTVTRWRRTIPSIEVWRAWLHDFFDRYDGMPEAIDRGDFDSIRSTLHMPGRGRSHFLAGIVPQLARIKTTAEIARLLGVSPRTVRRYRAD